MGYTLHNRATDWVTTMLTYLMVIIFILSIYVFMAYMESRTYNKLTGAHTTTWDAMWVNLRVQGNNQ